MSYILEALKKAQAERQLGDLPTIHAPTLHAAATPGRTGVRPLTLVLGAMGVAIAVLLALVWRQGKGDAPAPAPPVQQAVQVQQTAQQQQQQPAQPAVAALAPAPQAAAIPAPVNPPAPAPAPAPARLAAAAPAIPAPVPATAATPPAKSAATQPAKSTTTQQAAAGPAAAESAPQEDTTQTLRDLPEPIQRAIPPISVGGYIYSKNPADRLLLIDKVLRHEGEELAPGLTLEKLLPKAAVFNYKGYRYRVPY